MKINSNISEEFAHTENTTYSQIKYFYSHKSHLLEHKSFSLHPRCSYSQYSNDRALIHKKIQLFKTCLHINRFIVKYSQCNNFYSRKNRFFAKKLLPLRPKCSNSCRKCIYLYESPLIHRKSSIIEK